MDDASLAAVIAGIFTIIGLFFTKHMERRSVRTAIFAEIQRLLVVIASHEHKWQEWIDNKTTDKEPLIPFSCDVYQKHIVNLGLISSKYVSKVVQFYGYVNFINSIQQHRNEYKVTAEFDALYQSVLQNILKQFRDDLTAAISAHGLAEIKNE